MRALSRNLLLRWNDDSNNAASRIDRLLTVDSTGTFAVVIDIYDKSAWHRVLQVDQLQEALASGAAVLETTDPYDVILRREDPEQVTSERRKVIEHYYQIRDERWMLIEPLVSDPRIFDPRGGGKLIAQRGEITEKSNAQIRKVLRHYWQGGQKVDALFPRYVLSGGAGQKREVKQDSKKRGRKSKAVKAAEELGKEIPSGINITPENRAIFRRVYYEYHSKGKHTWSDSFDWMNKRFFTQHIEYYNDGYEPVPILLQEHQRPTIDQFKYWIGQEFDLVTILRAQQGRRAFLLKTRPLMGTAQQLAYGSGFQFQIDATIGDLYLVSRLNRNWVIGRPTIYLVRDTFSHLIVGLSVSLNSPSWSEAVWALVNVATDKMEFCQRYNIPCTPALWPNSHLCEELLGDRGEMASNMADSLVRGLDVRLVNNPPYRPDWKSIIEEGFRLLNDEVIHKLPAAVQGRRERGEKDSRLNAILDLYQFIRILIACVIKYNNYHRLVDYPLTEEMITDRVEPYPIKLWEWGIRRSTSLPRVVSPNQIRFHLLPRAEAKVTRYGIEFRGMTYLCERALRFNWLSTARVRGEWSVTVSYNPQRAWELYLHRAKDDPSLPGRQTELLELCWLHPERSKAFINCSLFEVEDYMNLTVLATAEARDRDNQGGALYDAVIEGTKAEAATETALDVGGLVGNIRLHDMTEHRQQDREAEEYERLMDHGLAMPAQRQSSTSPCPEPTAPATERVTPKRRYEDLILQRIEARKQQQGGSGDDQSS